MLRATEWAGFVGAGLAGLAYAIGDVVFVALGVVQLAATIIIIAYTTKYAGSSCASHLPVDPAPRSETVARSTEPPISPKEVLQKRVPSRGCNGVRG